MIKIVRVIDRLNIGGPAIHVSLLSAALSEPEYRTLLVHGQVEPHEGSLEGLPRERGVPTEQIVGLGRSVSPIKDLQALWRLYRLIRRERPQIVHTHKAKAGALGRLAARLAGVPVVVHTFHGHVLSGYFSPLKTRLIIAAERLLAGWTDRILVLSEEQRKDICTRFRVAPESKVRVVPLGLELARFSRGAASRDEARRRLGVPADAPSVGIAGRLAPIKNHQLFLHAAKRMLQELPQARFAIVGDGELRRELGALAQELGIADRVLFTGWLGRMEHVYPAFDVVALTSKNEGTPVTLIEAMACGVPVVATRVGGVPDVLGGGALGTLVPPGDPEAFASALCSAVRNRRESLARAEAAQARVLQLYSVERLAADVRAVYAQVLKGRAAGPCSARGSNRGGTE